MRTISALALLPVSILSFLGGALLGISRKNLSMLPPSPRAPLDIPILSWERFVAVMAVSPRDAITSRGRMGAFGMDARRLSDVAFMERPRKVTIGNEMGVWAGEWTKPLTQEKFLASMPAQYEAFSRSMKKLAPTVGAFVGCEIDGKKATLSGLLGVGHLAGEAGVESWVRNPEIRKKFASTTERFTKTNGIF